MTWSVNWDVTNGNRFANTVGPHLDALPRDRHRRHGSRNGIRAGWADQMNASELKNAG
ncbi:hypothetical protein [Micromonospora hortensis]|uniref:hypothetical protein n=1 Tax=Micromonospora hortensis TaxID=2911209 RepID=UPI001EE9401D|nr:hypothetical protein [Micromonospora hortensis]MCG5450665.1 hypothetical protein [Micromonospora hortensis]